MKPPKPFDSYALTSVDLSGAVYRNKDETPSQYFERFTQVARRVGFRDAFFLPASNITNSEMWALSNIVTDYYAIVVRGTDELSDWWANLRCYPVLRDGCLQHCGYVKRMEYIDEYGFPRSMLSDAYRELPRYVDSSTGQVAIKKLLLTGHSKGGAIAGQVAYRFARAGLPVDLRTFGSSRSIERYAARHFTQHCGGFAYEIAGDPVPKALNLLYGRMGNRIYMPDPTPGRFDYARNHDIVKAYGKAIRRHVQDVGVSNASRQSQSVKGIPRKTSRFVR